MRPKLDVVVSREYPFSPHPAAWIFLKYCYGLSEHAPAQLRKEQMLTLECQSIAELEDAVRELKAELDDCVKKARQSFAVAQQASR